jgi:hypothetical protein
MTPLGCLHQATKAQLFDGLQAARLYDEVQRRAIPAAN